MLLLVMLAIFSSIFLGGFFAIRLKDKLHLILGFSAGAVMGVAFFKLLPESLELAGARYEPRIITLFIILGFSIYMIFDRFFSLHCHDHQICENQLHRGRLGASALIVHSFLDGLGVGLSFQISAFLGWIFASAILVHGFSDGINTVNVILKNGGSQKLAQRWLFIDALAPVLGIIGSMFLSVSQTVFGIILAIFCGFFIYLGASDLIPESHHRHPTLWTTLATIFSMVLIYLATQLVDI